MLFTKYHYVRTQTESTFCSMFNIYSVSLVFCNYAGLYAQFLMGSDAVFEKNCVLQSLRPFVLL